MRQCNSFIHHISRPFFQNSMGHMKWCNFFLSASGPKLSYLIVAKHLKLSSYFFGKDIVLLPLSYYYSNNFKADDIWELNYAISSQLYLLLHYGSSIMKIIVSNIYFNSFSFRTYVKLPNSSSADKMTLDVKPNLSIGLISSVGYKSKNDSILRWVEIMTLKNCLDEVVCHIRWLDYMVKLLQLLFL